MIPVIAIDTNIIARFLLADHPELYTKAKEIFASCQRGIVKLYVDPIIVAETVWLLSSFYQQQKSETVYQLTDLISPSWIICPQKKLVIKALSLYKNNNLSFIDCWLATICKSKKIELRTFDTKLSKIK